MTTSELVQAVCERSDLSFSIPDRLAINDLQHRLTRLAWGEPVPCPPLLTLWEKWADS